MTMSTFPEEQDWNKKDDCLDLPSQEGFEAVGASNATNPGAHIPSAGQGFDPNIPKPHHESHPYKHEVLAVPMQGNEPGQAVKDVPLEKEKNDVIFDSQAGDTASYEGMNAATPVMEEDNPVPPTILTEHAHDTEQEESAGEDVPEPAKQDDGNNDFMEKLKDRLDDVKKNIFGNH